jgi:hypothetical protein
MTKEVELLLEQVTSAYRPVGVDGATRSAPAWHDLPADAREAAFERTAALRKLEAALDPKGLSTTAKAVLARIRQGR